MKPFSPYFTLLLGLGFVGLFWWGCAGFVASGSGGSPPQRQLSAFWIGGVGYLALLLFSYALGLTAANPLNRRFGASFGKNLKWTMIALLACFPAAFFFVGFIAPPFIPTASAITLLVSVLRGYERPDTAPVNHLPLQCPNSPTSSSTPCAPGVPSQPVACSAAMAFTTRG